MLTSRGLAAELHVSESTIRSYAQRGLIPFAETPGGHRRYDLDDVRSVLNRAKSHELKPLSGAEEEPRLASRASAPLRLAQDWRPSITRATIADVQESDNRAETVRIPSIGIPGSSRFVIGQGARA